MSNNFRQICLQNIRKNLTEGRCLIIGEVAQTHDGSLGQAHSFIDAIANAGADAVKFQTHIAAAESTPDEPWRIKFSPQDDTRYKYWQRMEFSKEQWAKLKDHADERGLLFLSSPFSMKAVELLDEIGMHVWKIASGEVNNIQLLDRIIATKNPIILSSGMSNWHELDKAVGQVRKAVNALAVLQCTSAYPCPPEKIGLNLLEVLQSRYNCPTGLSDHSGNIFAGLAATTLGAEVLEVHVTLSREMFGPDVAVSITTSELRQLVEGVRSIEKMTANPVEKESVAEELEPLRQIFTKSIYASSFLPAGTILDAENLQLKKPGTGIPAAELPKLIGLKLRRSLQSDELLLLEDIEL
ncbi:MAG: N-acetylneuraminate synthase family protein [Actinomycetota bacterium]